MDKFISKLRLPKDCDSVLCALSGGADSVSLLHALCTLGTERGIRVCAAHYDHGIRGAESKRDAAFAESFCRSLGVPFVTGEGDVPQFARENRLGTEEAARQLRYAFLEKAADELGCRYIATAHHADDNAETVLFNLARGSGAKGLCGIPRQRGRLIRPLLDVSRDEIKEYLTKNGLAHVEDSSNTDDAYTRNLLRHRVIPVLKELNPQFPAAVGRACTLLAQDEDYFTRRTEELIALYSDGESFPCDLLSTEHPALTSRVIRHLSGKPLSEKHVRAVLELAKGSGRGFADLPGLRIRREQGRIYFCPEELIHIPERPLVINGELVIPELGQKISARECVFSEEVYDPFNIYFLKCERIQKSLLCSAKKSGDSFAPIGRGCTKTLKSLFSEKKLSRRQRDSVLVIRDGAGIAAVVGFGTDRRFECRKGDPCIRIEIIDI